MMEISRSFTFEAAHRLTHLPAEHKCSRLHGHSFRVVISVCGHVHPRLHWVRDFDEIVAAFEPIRQQLDHNYLNDIHGLEYPTSEVIAAWIWDQICDVLQDLVSVTVEETCRSRCVYYGPREIM